MKLHVREVVSEAPFLLYARNPYFCNKSLALIILTRVSGDCIIQHTHTQFKHNMTNVAYSSLCEDCVLGHEHLSNKKTRFLIKKKKSVWKKKHVFLVNRKSCCSIRKLIFASADTPRERVENRMFNVSV